MVVGSSALASSAAASLTLPKLVVASTTSPTITAAYIATSVALGASGAVFVVPNLTPWYQNLNKPKWSPPNKVFAPVWTTLYALIGFAAARAFGHHPLRHGRALTVFSIHATANLAWAPVFFGLHRLRAGFFLSCLLLLLAVASSVEIGLLAGWGVGFLLVPYVAWLCYATGLNYRLWRLNE